MVSEFVPHDSRFRFRTLNHGLARNLNSMSACARGQRKVRTIDEGGFRLASAHHREYPFLSRRSSKETEGRLRIGMLYSEVSDMTTVSRKGDSGIGRIIEVRLVVLRQKTRRLFLLNLLTQYGHLGSILAIATIKR